MMGATTSLRDELDVLRTELGRKESKKPSSSFDPLSVKAGGEAAAQPAAMADLNEPLGELAKALSEHTGSLEDFVRERPLVSVLAAFALGIAVGRLTGKA